MKLKPVTQLETDALISASQKDTKRGRDAHAEIVRRLEKGVRAKNERKMLAAIGRTPEAPAPKATAPKPERTAKEKRDSALRQQAWDMRNASKAAGGKLTYAAACAKLGVKRSQDA